MFLGVFAGLLSIGPAGFLLDLTAPQIGICIVWACLFSVLCYDGNKFLQGLLFISGSVALSLLLVAYTNALKLDNLWAYEYVAQIMVIVGGGVGANYITSYMQEQNA